MKRVNERMSFYSRETFPKAEGVRFVQVAGKIQLDKTGTLLGRGAYLKKDEVLLALTKHAFNRAFHKDVTTEEEEAIKKAYESIK
jgi:predicted RNA-binding protein YlxR (DUF448 family)